MWKEWNLYDKIWWFESLKNVLGLLQDICDNRAAYADENLFVTNDHVITNKSPQIQLVSNIKYVNN